MPAIFTILLFIAPEWVRNLTKERQPDIFWAEYVLFPIIQILVLAIVIFMLIPWLLAMERKNTTPIQTRFAAGRVTPWAALRPASAGVKHLFSADRIPEGGDKAIFRIAPLIAFIAAFLALAVIPWGTTWATIANINIGLLFILAITSLSAVGLTIAGWSEVSKSDKVTALGSVAQIVAYYIGMGLAAGGVLIFAHTLSMTGIVEAQQADRIWYIAFQPFGFLLFLIATLTVTSCAPSAIPDAENTDSRWTLFLIIEKLQLIVLAATAVSLYLGGWSFPGVGSIRNQSLQTLVSILIFAAKTLLLLYGLLWLKRKIPFRELEDFGWRRMMMVGLLNILLTATLYLLAMPKARGGVFEWMRESSGRLISTGKGIAYFIITGVLLSAVFIWLARKKRQRL